MDDIIIWNNALRDEDLSVYGRYAAIQEAKHDIIYLQDDDCIVSNNAIKAMYLLREEGKIVSNTPDPFRKTYYQEHCLVGFGAIFHRDLPERAFQRWAASGNDRSGPVFLRTCDIVFTALTPHLMVDLPYENLSWATHDSRMYRQPGHVQERMGVLDKALALK